MSKQFPTTRENIKHNLQVQSTCTYDQLRRQELKVVKQSDIF